MKLFILIDGLDIGGAEKLLLNFIEKVKHDENITVKIGVLNPITDNFILDQISKANISVTSFQSNQTRELLDRRRFKQLFHYLKTEKFDLIHTHLLYSHIIGGIASIFTQTPFVATFHSERVDFNLIKKVLRNIIAFFAAKIFIVTTQIKNNNPKFLWKKMLYIPNGIHVPIQTVLSTTQRSTPDFFKVTFVGRLAKVKNVQTIITAIKKANLIDPTIVFHIIGSGPEEDELKHHAQINNQPNPNIIFHGLQKNIFPFLIQSDLFVLASENEGLPLSLLEAMSVGLPVVATPVGEISNVITEQSGILFPVGQADQLAQAIIELKNDPARCKQIAKHNIQIIKDHYSIESWWQTTCLAYKSILEKK